MSGLEWLVAVAMLVAVVGAVVPLLPGPVLAVAAVAAWSVLEPTTLGWAVLGVSAAIVVVGFVLSYLVPGRRLSQAGVPNSSLLAGAAAGLVGFFVVPVLGLPIGFVAGLYLAETRRLGSGESRRSTVLALKAVALNIAIDLATALSVAVVWLVAALHTPVGP
ncbi:DUF456 domain-containing protein [Nocardioidaceae bacterium]|nr:DUF456 domain-containing protein [Nocardioidaceae bacterium]